MVEIKPMELKCGKCKNTTFNIKTGTGSTTALCTQCGTDWVMMDRKEETYNMSLFEIIEHVAFLKIME